MGKNKRQEHMEKLEEACSSFRELCSDIKEKLDFVYIDGNHNYEFVMKDLNAYYDLVKKDGILCGHDYDIPKNKLSDNGVRQAVNDFFEKKGLTVHSAICTDDGRTEDWWVFKE